jgi:hypothetical protein
VANATPQPQALGVLMEELDSLVGANIELSYYDQNESFAGCLPVNGKMISRHETDNVNNWFLLELGQTIEYSNQTYKHLLIRSKWQGQEISASDETAVFILLVSKSQQVPNRISNIEDYEHVAWGFAIVSHT